MSDRKTTDSAYISRSLDRLTTEVAGLRDDMKVLTAIVLRYEETLIRVLEQITAMVSQNARHRRSPARHLSDGDAL